MKVEIAGTAKPLAALTDAAIVMALNANITVCAIKGSKIEGGKPIPYFAMLGPFPSIAKDDYGKPHLRDGRTVPNEHFLELPDALIVPRLTPESILVGWEGRVTPGCLLIAGAKKYLTIASGGAVSVIDLEIGAITPEISARPDAMMCCLSWRVVIPQCGEFAEIFRFDATEQKSADH